MKLCSFPDCGRAAYARGLCQTHHRQLLTTGTLTRIRPYRSRIPGTEKFSGLRLSPDCVRKLAARAEQERLSNGATIATILEQWLLDGAPWPPGR